MEPEQQEQQNKAKERILKFSTFCFLPTNTLILVLGLGMMITGSLALIGVHKKINTDDITPLMDTITADGKQPVDILKNLFIFVIVTGVITIILVPVLLFMILRETKYAGAAYAPVILMLFVFEIIIIAILVTEKNKVEHETKSKMFLALDHFKEDTTTNSNPISNAWNILFMTLDCCGVNAVESTTNDFDSTPWCTTLGSCQATSSQIPKTCCLNVDKNTYASAPAICHASVTNGTYNQKGCFEALEETLLSYSNSILGVTSTTAVLEIFAVGIDFIWLLFQDKLNGPCIFATTVGCIIPMSVGIILEQ